MVTCYYWLLWEDDENREWAHRVETRDIEEARKNHAQSKQFNWVTERMRKPMVSSLWAQDGRSETPLAAGWRQGDTHTPERTQQSPDDALPFG